MSSSLRISGAIAQLGERLLCKQEVVGSIPSGSTIGWRSPRREASSSLFLQIRGRDRQVSTPVLFSNREEVTQSSFPEGTRPHRGGGDDECVHEVSWSFRSVPNLQASNVKRPWRASTMRAIKCLKGIRWMPWR